MRVKSGAVVIDLIQEKMAGVVRIMADVEQAASRLVACRGGGILAHQRQEGVDLFQIDLEIDNAALDWAMSCVVFFCLPILFAGDDVAQSPTSAQSIIDDF